MAHHLRLTFHGYVEMKKASRIYVVKYVLGQRDPRPLSFSRWCQVAPSFSWGVSDSPGCTQLAWTILFAYLIKQTDLADNRQTADLLTDKLVERFARHHVCNLPETWLLSGKVIAKFLVKSQFPFPNSNSHSNS